MFGLPLSRILIASVIVGALGISGLLSTSQSNPENISLYLESERNSYSVGDTFSVAVILESPVPVNVFKGMLLFNNNMLSVTEINYNTSLADLWAEEPWYSNGDGTLNFTGGTTVKGGFTGKDVLFVVTFKAKTEGSAALSLREMRVLKHDGLGSDALVNRPIDSLFSITPVPASVANTPTQDSKKSKVLMILPTDISTDLNNDGKQSISDTSIFMVHLASKNLRSDFNQDGTVDLKDLSILMR